MRQQSEMTAQPAQVVQIGLVGSLAKDSTPGSSPGSVQHVAEQCGSKVQGKTGTGNFHVVLKDNGKRIKDKPNYRFRLSDLAFVFQCGASGASRDKFEVKLTKTTGLAYRRR